MADAQSQKGDTRRLSPIWLEIATAIGLITMIGGVLLAIFEAFNDHGYLIVGVISAVVGLLLLAWFFNFKKSCNYRSRLDGHDSSGRFTWFGGSDGDSGDSGGGDGGD